MIGLIAVAIALETSGASPDAIPPEFHGQWHAGNTPCGENIVPGNVVVMDVALRLETEEGGSVSEIEFGISRLHKISDRELLAVGNWRENTIDNPKTSVRLALSRDRKWLSIRLSGWQGRFARCPTIKE